MMYATTNGLMAFLGDSADEWIDNNPDVDRLVSDCEARMAAYIMPNTPRCSDQAAALETAVYAQLEFEGNAANAQISKMPGGLSGFTVNGFSATFSAGANSAIFPLGISKRAKSELLLAGLLYRGVSVC